MNKALALVVLVSLAASLASCGKSKPAPSHEGHPARATSTPQPTSAANARPTPSIIPDPAEKYTCSMHPEIVSDKPGKCPKCGMTLVPVNGEAIPATEDEEKAVAPASGTTGRLVNVNTATLAELDAVNGIGLATARKIIAYRDDHGPLRSIDDLKAAEIHGCILGKIKNQITFTGGSGPTANAPATGRAAATVSPTTSASAEPAGPRPNINTATLAQLDAVSGIGEATAKRIIAARYAAGNKFSDWSEIDAVSGVGAVTIEKLKTAFELK